MSLELDQGLNWNIKYRNNLSGTREGPLGQYLKPEKIPPIRLDLRSPLIAIGIGAIEAKPDWFLGCYASLLHNITVSSTSNFLSFVNDTANNIKCRINYLNLIKFDHYGNQRSTLQLDFPKYIHDVYVEIWEYSEDSRAVFNPPSTDPYSWAEDLKSIKVFQQGGEFNLEITETTNEN